MEIHIRKLVRRFSVKMKPLRQLLERILTEEGFPTGEVSVVLVNDVIIRDLNRHYADIDEPTDVLSFPMLEGEPAPHKDSVLLGDVVISLETAQRQSPDTLQQEIERLLVHGTLHLLGYDHHSARSAMKMRKRSEHYVGR